MELTEQDVFKMAGDLWAGTPPGVIRESEYARGQVELIRDMFGGHEDYEEAFSEILEKIVDSVP